MVGLLAGNGGNGQSIDNGGEGGGWKERGRI